MPSMQCLWFRYRVLSGEGKQVFNGFLDRLAQQKMETPSLKTTTSPPPKEEPDLIRPRMPTTSSDNEEAATTTAGDTTPKIQRYERHNIAIFLGYCGFGYKGMQRNPAYKTIEGELEEALFQSAAVPEQDRGIPKRYDWARAARTDKDVSAVGQVVSGQFFIDPPGLVERLNSYLLPQIRVFGYKRVMVSFDAKKFCDQRRYVYLIPVFALDPCSHRARKSVLASFGSSNELVECLECSWRRRKVVGSVGKRRFELKSRVSRLDISSNDKDAIIKSQIKDLSVLTVDGDGDGDGDGDDRNSESVNEPKALEHDDIETVSVIPESSISSNSEEADAIPEVKEEGIVFLSNSGDDHTKSEEEVMKRKRNRFCYGDNEKEMFNRILNYYVGSHNFHNFTTRIKAEDPSAQRHIVSFYAKTTVTVEGIEFVKCEVIGRSFMLHQIRKMIGFAVAIMRNCAPESSIRTALQKDININVPTAPEVGLYLDECIFTSYNQESKDCHCEEVSMKDYEAEAEDFKMKHIYSHIASREHTKGTVAVWLHSLNHRNYPDLRVGHGRDTNNSGDDNGRMF